MNKAVLYLFTVLIISGCAGTALYVPPDENTLVDTATSAADLRSMAQHMARSMLKCNRIAGAQTPPRIAFIEMVNRTTDDVDSYNLLSQIRTLLLKHSEGKIVFLDREKSDAIQEERKLKRDGKVGSSGEKVLSGVDYFLTGRAYSLDKRDKGKKDVYYRFSFRLTDAENSDIIWEDEYEFKKAGKYSLMYQ